MEAPMIRPSHPHVPPRNASGFSVVEFLIVVFIFALGVLGLSLLQVMSIRGNHSGRQRSTAVYLASTVVERVQAEGQLSLAGFPPTRVFTASTVTDDAVNSFGTYDVHGNPATGATAIYTVSWSRRAYRGGASSSVTGLNLREFVVNVGWNEQDSQGSNIPKAISISRYVRY